MFLSTRIPDVEIPANLVDIGEPLETEIVNGSRSGQFEELNDFLETWFYKPDLQAIRIVLGTIKAHYLKIGDPAWLFIVAPPGAGKSTISIMGAAGLEQVTLLGDFTESTFLSGFYGHQQPGMLEKLGEPNHRGNLQTTEGDAIFLVKDFTTVLGMRREKRGVILSQLREIHDGEFRRDFGTGESKVWRGRVTIVAAVTPALDRHYSIFSTLGERFLQLRWHRPDSEVAGEWAIRQQGKEEEIRQEARRVIGQIMSNSLNEPPVLQDEMKKRIANMAEVIAVGRTHVYRNNYGRREIEYVPEAEANTRISKGLAAIARGVAALNRHEEVGEEDIQDVFRVGLDCLPQNRQRLLLAVLQSKDVESIKMPRTVKERELEELKALEILEENSQELTERFQGLLTTACLKME